MNISHIEHIGIAVKSIEESIKYYEEVLGLKCYSIEEVTDQKVKKVGILGAGMMGAGISYVSAMAGIEVILLDMKKEDLDQEIESVNSELTESA